MERDQAEEIHRHLLDASKALARAGDAILGLGDAERRTLAYPMAEISYRSFDLLQLIYREFPDLEPPLAEVPTIESELCWADVHLPAFISEAALDEMIFSLLLPRWQKTARILGEAQQHSQARSWPIEAEVVAARIRELAEAGLIDHQGDLRYWRFSEVRLKPRLTLLS